MSAQMVYSHTMSAQMVYSHTMSAQMVYSHSMSAQMVYSHSMSAQMVYSHILSAQIVFSDTIGAQMVYSHTMSFSFLLVLISLNGIENGSPPSLTTPDRELVSVLEVRIEPGDLNRRPLTPQSITLLTIPRAGLRRF